MEDATFEIENEYGQKVILSVLATVDDEEKGINYMIYTDGTFDEDENLNIYVSQVVNDENGFYLEEVEDYETIDLVTKEIDKIFEKNRA